MKALEYSNEMIEVNNLRLLICELLVAFWWYRRRRNMKKRRRNMKKRRCKHKYWVRLIFQWRYELGQFHMLFSELRFTRTRIFS